MKESVFHDFITVPFSKKSVFSCDAVCINLHIDAHICQFFHKIQTVACGFVTFYMCHDRLISSGEQCTETFPYIAFFRIMGKFCKNIPRTGHCHYFLFSEHGKHLHIGVKLTSQIHMEIRAYL